MAHPIGRWLSSRRSSDILLIALLLAALLAMAGCANTGRATDDIRLMVGDMRAAITRFEARQSDTSDEMDDLVDLTKTILVAAEAGADGIDKIKDATVADFKAAGVAAVQAGATSLLGPGAGGLVADLAPYLLAGLFGADSLRQRGKRGKSEVAHALATTPPRPEPAT